MNKKPEDRFTSANVLINELLRARLNLEKILEGQENVTIMPSDPADTAPIRNIEADSISYCLEPGYIERAAELHEVISLYEQCQENYFTLAIFGEEGIGKSRLVNEFARWLATNHIQVYFGHSHAGVERPYQILNDLFHHMLFKPADEDFSHTVLLPDELKLQQALEKNVFPELLHPLVKPQNTKGTEYQWKLKKQKGTHWMRLLNWLLEASEDKPLVVVLEDMQECTREEWQFIRYALLSIKEKGSKKDKWPRIFFVVTIKHEEFLETSTNLGYLDKIEKDCSLHKIHLKPFSLKNTEKLVQLLLGCGQVPDHLVQTVQDISQGNPFFIEEIVHNLVKQDIFSRAEHRLILNESDEIIEFDETSYASYIPSNYSEFIAKKLNSLEPELQTVLSIAAVIGRQFDFTTVQQISGLSTSQLLLDVHRLIDANLIIDDISADSIYYFRHSLVHEIFYTTIDFEERKELHHGIAALWAERPLMQRYLAASGIARHYEECHEFLKASEFFMQAGDFACYCTASDLAQDYYNRALVLFRRFIQESSWGEEKNKLLLYQTEILEKIGIYYLFIGRHGNSRQYFEQMMETARSLGDERWLARAYDRLGEVFLFMNDLEKAREYLDKSFDLLSALDDIQELKKNRELFGKYHVLQKTYDEATRYLYEVLQLQLYLSPNVLVYAHHHLLLSQIYMQSRDLEKAEETCQRALQKLEHDLHTNYLYEPLRIMQEINFLKKDLTESETYRERALTLARESFNQLEEALTLLHSSHLDLSAGDMSLFQKDTERVRKLAWILDEIDLFML